MNKTVIILALLLVLGTVFIAGCTTTTQNNTSGMGQNKSPTTAAYRRPCNPLDRLVWT
ncbi:MAG: hypothetical protein K8E24_001060 [Methanobacterium paludis]|nr:hypothetical protein [Methanobacterium paludis]